MNRSYRTDTDAGNFRAKSWTNWYSGMRSYQGVHLAALSGSETQAPLRAASCLDRDVPQSECHRYRQHQRTMHCVRSGRAVAPHTPSTNSQRTAIRPSDQAIDRRPDQQRTVPYRSRAKARKCRPTGRSGSAERASAPPRTDSGRSRRHHRQRRTSHPPRPRLADHIDPTEAAVRVV